MAILSKFEATVSINGTDAPEFDAEEDELEENKVVKYIESTTGANFSFKFALHPRHKLKCSLLTFEIHIDGQWVTGGVLEKSEFPKTKSRNPVRTSCEGVRSKNGGQCVKQEFKFSDISFGKLVSTIGLNLVDSNLFWQDNLAKIKIVPNVFPRPVHYAWKCGANVSYARRRV